MNIEETKKAIYSFTYGVYIITSRHEREISGMAAVWVTQISKDPMQLALGLTPESATTQMLLKSGVFAVNVLTREQRDLAYFMGRTTSSESNKFEGVRTVTRVTGSPILSEAAAWLDCKLVSQMKVGSHLVIIGEVMDGAVLADAEPATYRNGKIL